MFSSLSKLQQDLIQALEEIFPRDEQREFTLVSREQSYNVTLRHGTKGQTTEGETDYFLSVRAQNDPSIRCSYKIDPTGTDLDESHTRIFFHRIGRVTTIPNEEWEGILSSLTRAIRSGDHDQPQPVMAKAQIAKGLRTVSLPEHVTVNSRSTTEGLTIVELNRGDLVQIEISVDASSRAPRKQSEESGFLQIAREALIGTAEFKNIKIFDVQWLHQSGNDLDQIEICGRKLRPRYRDEHIPFNTDDPAGIYMYRVLPRTEREGARYNRVLFFMIEPNK